MCSCSLCFSLPLIFTLVNATISHFLTAAIKFSRFSSNEIALRCFFISRTSSFPVIHVIYTLKFSRKKDFLSLKVRAAVQFTAETGSVLEMQNFISTYMKGRTDVRTYGWTKSGLGCKFSYPWCSAARASRAHDLHCNRCTQVLLRQNRPPAAF